MALQTNAPAGTHWPVDNGSHEVTEYDTYIESRLDKTRSYVKWVDVTSGALHMAAGVIAFLFVLVLIDHWLVGFSTPARTLAWLALFATCVAYFVRKVAGPLTHRVSSVYAAQAIEASEPSIKNSLINFILLRGDQARPREVIFRAMQQRAATDLAHVEVDSVVDRSSVIRVGCVLAALVTIVGCYKLLSPKDPFQSVARVLLPWREIERPSRVLISNVTPGDAQVYYGRSVEISAKVRGVRADEPVRLVYGTVDGRVVGRQVPMQLPEGRVKHQGQLPPDNVGVEHDLVYHLQAGDVVTRDYHITVLPAPSISVESVEYKFPEYTGLSPVSVSRQGDISALEGTRVTVRGSANEDIKSAYIEFDPESVRDPGKPSSGADRPIRQVRRATSPMKATGREARVSFTLFVLPDRVTPSRTSYQLRFTTPDGHTNEEPVQYRIDVTPDLAPEVEILQPTQQDIELPLDGRQTVEIRAIDPDFGLTSVRLLAAKTLAEDTDSASPKGNRLATDEDNEPFLEHPLSSDLHTGPFVATFDFIPRQLLLSEGDVVEYWAAASDNRTSSRADDPGPNMSTTAKYVMRIVAPQRVGEPTPAKHDSTPHPKSPDARRSDDGTAGQPQTSQESGTGEGQDQDGSADSQDAGNESGDGQQGDQATADNQRGQSGTERSDRGSGDESQASKGGSNESGDGQSDGNNPGDSSQGQGPGGAEGSDRPGSASSDQPNDGASGQDATDNGFDNGQPLPSDGTRDGDAFDRIMERMRETGSDNSSEESTQRDGQESAENESRDAQREDGSRSNGESESSRDRQGDPSQEGQSSDSRARSKPESDESQTGRAGNTDDAKESDVEQQSGTGDSSGPDAQSSEDDGDTDAQSGDSRPQTEQPDGEAVAESDRQSSQTPPEGTDGKQDNRTTPDEGSRSDPESATDGARTSEGDAPTDSGGEGGKDAAEDPANKKDSPRPSRSSDGGDSRRDGANRDAASEPRPNQTEEPASSGSSEALNGSEGGSADGSETDGNEGDATRMSGGKSGGPSDTPDSRSDAEPAGDDPNLEYAREATDLVLEYLKDQQNEADPELLDRLGWSKEELRKFAARWEQMKRDASRRDERGRQARGKLDNALRSLGIAPARDRLRRGESSDERQGGVGDSGVRTSPPAQFRELYKAYLRSVARDADASADP